MDLDFELDKGTVNSQPGADPVDRGNMSVLRLMKLIFALACLFALISVAAPARERPRELGTRAAGTMRQQPQADRSSHSTAITSEYGVLPPAYVADASGRPMHSWRVLILPFLDQQSLYNQYDFREPWDGPHNIKLLDKHALLLRLPEPALVSHEPDELRGDHRPGHDVPGHHVRQVRGRHRRAIRHADGGGNRERQHPLDGARSTSTLRTMSLQINDPSRPGISSKHPHGAIVVFGDARCQFLE